jgi:hypothetical protein
MLFSFFVSLPWLPHAKTSTLKKRKDINNNMKYFLDIFLKYTKFG